MGKREFTEENLKEIINHQFKINGHSVDYKYIKTNYKDNNEWLFKYNCTKEKEDEFIVWLEEYLKPFLAKKFIKKEAGWMVLNYGLSYYKEEVTSQEAQATPID